MTEINQSEDGARRAAPGGGVPPGTAAAGMLRMAEAWTDAQCEFLSGVEAIWSEWMSRQRDAIDASARSLQRMCECHTAADLARVQQQWFADALQRGAADFGALSGLACDAVAATWRTQAAERSKQRTPTPPARRTGAARTGVDAAPERAAAE